jgi:hypothetical protein
LFGLILICFRVSSIKYRAASVFMTCLKTLCTPTSFGWNSPVPVSHTFNTNYKRKLHQILTATRYEYEPNPSKRCFHPDAKFLTTMHWPAVDYQKCFHIIEAFFPSNTFKIWHDDFLDVLITTYSLVD